MRDELCLEEEMDKHWGSLLATMAPSCVSANIALTRISDLLRLTRGRLTLLMAETICPPPEITIPATLEESFDTFVSSRD